MSATPVGRVIGNEASFALEFWVWVEPDRYLQLDDVVTVEFALPDGQLIEVHGVVDQVRSRYEGARFDSDADLAAQQLLPVDIANAAHVTVTRVEPEIFVAPDSPYGGFKASAMAARSDMLRKSFMDGLSSEPVSFGN